MKIIRITTVPITLATILLDQLVYLSKKGINFVLISSDGSAWDKLEESILPKQFYRIKMHRKITPIKDLWGIIKLYRIFKLEKPNIIHSHTPKAGLLSMIAGKLAKVPVRVHTVGGLPLIDTHGIKMHILIWVERLTYFFATDVIVNSFNLHEYIRNSITTSKKIQVLGFGATKGIDIERFLAASKNNPISRAELAIKEETFVWLYVGRVVKSKGIQELLKAFTKIAEKRDMKLLIIGQFEEDLDPIDQDLKDLMLNSSEITYLGHQENISPFYSISNAFVFPSYREGFPNVLLEASCHELPIIASNINGCNELITNNYNGLLCEPKNIEDLKQKMNYLYSNFSQLSSLGTEAKKVVVEKYSFHFVADSLYEFYKSKNV